MRTVNGKTDRVVIVGAGLSGLSAALQLAGRGRAVTVVERGEHPGGRVGRADIGGYRIDTGPTVLTMPDIIDDAFAAVGRSLAECLPIDPVAPAYHASFADGSALGADVVVFSAGIRPQDSLARDAGLECGPRGGIVVDEHCRSSDPDVHAIGECALYDGRIFGLVAPGYRMAEAAARPPPQLEEAGESAAVEPCTAVVEPDRVRGRIRSMVGPWPPWPPWPPLKEKL